MRLNPQEIETIKSYIDAQPCNWCKGKVKLYAVAKIKRPKVTGVIQCTKCERINPATFVLPKVSSI